MYNIKNLNSCNLFFANSIAKFYLIVFLVVSSNLLAPNAIYAQINRMKVMQTEDVTIYYPKYKSLDLSCGDMPNSSDSSIIFCAEAAYTGELLTTFSHLNIAGNHVSSGVFYKGYACEDNTGAFIYYNNKWKFIFGDNQSEMLNAEKYKGMAFGQSMIIHNGDTKPLTRSATSENYYRALSELNGKLCIIDSRNIIPYSKFVKDLELLGVTNAIYLDMGEGWNYSWYRDSSDVLHFIHSIRIPFTTNWIVFR